MIEDKISELLIKENNYMNLVQSKMDEQIMYYTSKTRENLLNWYDFRTEGRLLEVDGACGSITGMLCEKVAEVISCERTEERKMLNLMRNSDKKNLTVIAKRMCDIEDESKFDYIVVNDVFFNTQNEKAFFDRLLQLLKSDGRILIAVENRIGARYFSGAAEKESQIMFGNIMEENETLNRHVFSRDEWNTFMNNYMDLDWVFYYPYPDHLYPMEIFTEESIYSMKMGRPYYNLLNKRYTIGCESVLWKILQQEGVAEHFANSFLLEVGRGNVKHCIEYAKLSSDRSEKFQIGTKIVNVEKGKSVYKYPLNSEAMDHIEKLLLHEREDCNPDIHCLKGERLENGLKYPFLEETTVDELIEKALYRQDVVEFKKILQAVFASYFVNCRVVEYHNDTFSKIFGKEKAEIPLECICPANIDLICDNIFKTEKGYEVIDCEWVLDIYVPKKFIIWRNINELYGKHLKLGNSIPKEELLAEYGIDTTLSGIFETWNWHFTMEYVGANQLEKYAKPFISVSEENLKVGHDNYQFIKSCMYIDYGQGYQEENKLSFWICVQKNIFDLVIRIPNAEKVKRLRWDPVEERGCICKVICGEEENMQKAHAINATACNDGKDIFISIDPQYQIPVNCIRNDFLRISGEFYELSLNEQEKCNSERNEKLNRKEAYIQVLEDVSRRVAEQQKILMGEIEREKEEKQKLIDQLYLMENSRGYKMLQLFRRIKHKVWR